MKLSLLFAGLAALATALPAGADPDAALASRRPDPVVQCARVFVWCLGVRDGVHLQLHSLTIIELWRLGGEVLLERLQGEGYQVGPEGTLPSLEQAGVRTISY